MNRTFAAAAVSALAVALVAGCRSNPGEAPSAAPAPVAPAADPAAAAPADPGAQRDVAPPLVMHLDPTGPADGIGEVEVAVRFDVPAPLGYPVRLQATLPKQASLLASELDAPLGPAETGTLVRRMKLRTSSPLTLEAPLVVTADGQSPSGAVGLHAEQQLPPKPSMHVAPRQGPEPPGGRPPGPIRR